MVLDLQSLGYARWRCREWPTADPELTEILLRELPSGPQKVTPFGEEVIEAEYALFNPSQLLPSDPLFADQPYIHKKKHLDILRGLYWRARRQSAIWDVFHVLVEMGYIDPQCLAEPFDPTAKHSGRTFGITIFLSSFDRPAIDAMTSNVLPLSGGAEWNFDILWLAAMIVRGGKNLPELMAVISCTQLLGRFDPDEYQHRWEQFYLQGRRYAERKLSPMSVSTNGFWLPHGVTTAREIQYRLHRFNRIEEAFIENFNSSEHQLVLKRKEFTIPELVELQPDLSEDEIGCLRELSNGIYQGFD